MCGISDQNTATTKNAGNIPSIDECSKKNRKLFWRWCGLRFQRNPNQIMKLYENLNLLFAK